MRIAYFDCFAGAAGDMIVGAMLDAGLDERFLRDRIASLGISGLEIRIQRVKRAGMSAVHFATEVSGHQHHRGLRDIKEIINRSDIVDSAKRRAVSIFQRLAEVEGRIHAKDPEDIHFHEVGAVDSIVDIVGACAGMEALGIEKSFASPLSVGGGTIKCAHGIMPAPAPATVELLKQIHAPIAGGPVDAELLTPTAAAILAEIVSQFGVLPPMRIESTGCGAGTREFSGLPNVLRLVIGSTGESGANADTVCLLECNVDDADGETIGHVFETLLGQDVLDVFTTAVSMKHNRPAVKLSVLAEPGKVARVEEVLFTQGLTLGVRKQMLERSILGREVVRVETEFGPVRVKTGIFGGKAVFAKPEYADCSSVAAARKVSLKEVHYAAMAAYMRARKMQVGEQERNPVQPNDLQE